MAVPAAKLRMASATFESSRGPFSIGLLGESGRRKPGIRRTRAGNQLFSIPKMVERVNEKYGASFRIMKYQRLDLILSLAADLGVACTSPFPSGDILAYGEPDAELGKWIVFKAGPISRVILPAGKYRREKGAALVVPEVHIDEVKRDKRDTIIDVPDSRLVLVPDFPRADGWYLLHKETGIPHGRMVGYSAGARHLWRLPSPYVYFPVRTMDFYRQYLHAYFHPCTPLSVLVEIPPEDVDKIEPPPKVIAGRVGSHAL